jgi:serine/threonine protein kinase
MEYCSEIQFYTNKKQFESEVKKNLFTLHKFKIIHKDIKPSNILYSNSYDKYVLTDFGISHII